MIQADRKCIMMAAAFLLAPVCYAQAVAVAEVQGQVVDGSGSAVPGAQIKMTQTETDYVRNTTAGAATACPTCPLAPTRLKSSRTVSRRTSSRESSCKSAVAFRSMSPCKSAR
jgi:hypothetical protein